MTGVVLLLAPVTSAVAAPTKVNLRTAGNFSVLAGSGVTNTGATVIKAAPDSGVTDNLGVSPETAISGFPPGEVQAPGTTHVGTDGVAVLAQTNLTSAYVQAASSPCDEQLTGKDLGGLKLTTGTYCFDSSAQLTGALTLDAADKPNSVFIFRIGSALTTATNSSVVGIRGAQACNVFWQVGSSATLGKQTQFVGNLLALTSITLVNGTDVEGRLLARNGAVTLDDNTITTSACAPRTGVAQAPLFGHLSVLVTFVALAAGITVYVLFRRRSSRISVLALS